MFSENCITTGIVCLLSFITMVCVGRCPCDNKFHNARLTMLSSQFALISLKYWLRIVREFSHSTKKKKIQLNISIPKHNSTTMCDHHTSNIYSIQFELNVYG